MRVARRGGQRAAAGKLTHAKARLGMHRVFEPVWSRDPLGPGGPWVPGIVDRRGRGLGFRDPAVAVLIAAIAVPAGDSHA